MLQVHRRRSFCGRASSFALTRISCIRCASGWQHASSRKRPAPGIVPAKLPEVTLLVAAHNEERVIEEKILDSLALHYPSRRLNIVVASDGSTDATPAIVARYRGRGVRPTALPREARQVGRFEMQRSPRPAARSLYFPTQTRSTGPMPSSNWPAGLPIPASTRSAACSCEIRPTRDERRRAVSWRV